MQQFLLLPSKSFLEYYFLFLYTFILMVDYKLFIGFIFGEAGYHLIDLMYLKPSFFFF